MTMSLERHLHTLGQIENMKAFWSTLRIASLS
jgi:hypothetical protein